MKKRKLLCLFFSLRAALCFAQDVGYDQSINLIKANAKSLNINIEKDELPVITNSYTDAALGLTYIYAQQSYKSIKLFNVIKSIVVKNNDLQTYEGDFVANTQNICNEPVPVLTAVQSIIKAAEYLGLKNTGEIRLLKDDFAKTKKYQFYSGQLSKRNIDAELVWCSIDDRKTFKLAWNVSIDVINSSDYWNVRIDAANGNFLEKNNYTVYEKEVREHHSNTHFNDCAGLNITSAKLKLLDQGTTTANYRVIAFPKENRNISPGVTLETNPWNLAGAGNNATTYGWHYDGSNDFNITQGNNVFAYDDSLNINGPGRYPTSSTTIPTLSFLATPTFTKQPTTPQNREFNTTNLFYWNNIMHDLYYQYGFTEPAGNFQASNINRGGTENDYVMAEAQDGGGTNNANFSTPPDGQNGRMQMYLWTTATIKPDGDADNGVICHEFGHGISTRLTGGPANSSCLYNYEQGGEGWSDYFALMTTTNWAIAKKTDGTKSRAVGTYVMAQGLTGNGLRTFPYTTDMNVNPHTYLDVSNNTAYPQLDANNHPIPNATEVHYIGEVWCSALWDMTWNIIEQVGYIHPNIFDANGNGGNTIALNLVIQGLKFQKCSPGFLDARNAILKADSILYGNLYHCAIWNAFARRGMGSGALQGLSTKTTDQTDNYNYACYNLSGRIINPMGVAVNNAYFFNKKYNYYWKAKDSSKAYFEFEVTPAFNKTIYGSKKNEVTKANGVTSSDVLFIQRHILGTAKLNSPYKIIAADVDGNKQINATDVLRIKRLILGTDTTFKNILTNENRTWVFVDSSYVFPDTTNPFPYKDSLTFTTVNANKPNQTFIGLKLGDVNYDWNPSVAKGVRHEALILNSKEEELIVDNRLQAVTINLTSSNFVNISSLQSTLHFDNSKYEFADIKNGKLNIDFNAVQANKTGNISLLWIDKNAEAKTFNADDILFTIVLRPISKNIVKANTDLAVTGDITQALAYDNNLNEKKIILQKQNITIPVTVNNYLLLYPNPAKGNVTIETKGVKEVQVIDVLGKLIKREQLKGGSDNNTSIINYQLNKGLFIVKAIMNDGSERNEKLIVE